MGQILLGTAHAKADEKQFLPGGASVCEEGGHVQWGTRAGPVADGGRGRARPEKRWEPRPTHKTIRKKEQFSRHSQHEDQAEAALLEFGHRLPHKEGRS